MYIHKPALFEWDEGKNTYNQAKHGLRFEEALGFNWDKALFLDRSRFVDEEPRYAAVNYFRKKLHTIIFTRRGTMTRIISMRRSNRQEEKDYEKAIAQKTEGI